MRIKITKASLTKQQKKTCNKDKKRMQLLSTWIFVLFVALFLGNSRALQDEILEEEEEREQKEEEEEEGGQSHLTRPPPPKETI